MRVVFNELLLPLCNEQHTYEQLIEAISQATQDAGPGGYVYVHRNSRCTDEDCHSGSPVTIGPLPEHS